MTAKAPAAEAGLKRDDIITIVDGKPATSIVLYDLRYRLRNDAPGTRVRFTIDRKGTAREIDVTLRDLI